MNPRRGSTNFNFFPPFSLQQARRLTKLCARRRQGYLVVGFEIHTAVEERMIRCITSSKRADVELKLDNYLTNWYLYMHASDLHRKEGHQTYIQIRSFVGLHQFTLGLSDVEKRVN